GVDLEHTEWLSCTLPQRHAEHGTDAGLLYTWSLGETGLGRDVLAEDGLALDDDVAEDRPANERRGGGGPAIPSRPEDQRLPPPVPEQNEAPLGPREDPEEGLQDMT